MRHTKCLAIWMVASAAFLGAQIDPPSRVGRLNFIDGAVSFQPAGEEDWVDAARNRPLIAGDSIWVGDRARAELHVGSTALRLGANTAFQFINLDDRAVQIRLTDGTLTIHMRDFSQGQVFEVNTPNLAFTLNEPGEYRIDADPDAQTTFITVRIGEGEVTGGGQSFPLKTRQHAVVTGDDEISYRLASAPTTDAWDRWCMDRDRREDQSESARYVSREMPGYEDLDQYGGWSNQPEYGDVWMPTNVSAGWAPYRDGHWAWITPWGWTWVDDAPWGFAPYHYGRWASIRGRWGWIPGPRGNSPIYAPALVAWVGGGGFSASVGWFPLGFREPYRPSYNVSPRYLQRVNYNTINVNIRYVNRNVQNGVTAVPQDVFARGHRVEARPLSPAQIRSIQVIGHPAIAPQRESVFGGRDRGIQPPARVFERRVVVRTAPPAAPIPFARQQEALARNAGRPLPSAEVQQIRREAPGQSRQVRIVDRSQVRRVEPQVQQAPIQRRNDKPGRQQQSTQVVQPPTPPAVIERRNERTPRPQQPHAETPQAQPASPAVIEPRNERPSHQPQAPQAEQPRAQPAPPAVIERRNEQRGGAERQPRSEQPAANDRPDERRSRQPQPEAAPPQPDRSQQTPAAEREQRKEKGKQDRPPKDDKKPGQ